MATLGSFSEFWRSFFGALGLLMLPFWIHVGGLGTSRRALDGQLGPGVARISWDRPILIDFEAKMESQRSPEFDQK